MTFEMHVMHPTSAFPYIIATTYDDLVAPMYVMQHDVALWNQSSTGYSLPYPRLSGNENAMIGEYFRDELATCNAGVTPKGCGANYLSMPLQGSLAGTGPYVIKSVNPATSDMVLTANPTYWGGPYQYSGGARIQPKITTIKINYVPDLTTRELDLRNAADSGTAMAIDAPTTNLYDFASRAVWVTNRTLVSVINGLTLLGPAISYTTEFFPYETNVTNPNTLRFYKFQPFSDVRFRLAFADAVNMTVENIAINNDMGKIAMNDIAPGLPPAGAYNASITPRYSYDPDQVQNLLLDVMTHPLTSFTFVNGTVARPGVFNNTFGCKALTNGRCSNPVPQSISLDYMNTDPFSGAILTDIASVVNNVSATYNMGLTVQVAPLPFSLLNTEAFSGQVYMYNVMGWSADYPWVTDFLGGAFPAGGAYPAGDSWNMSGMNELFKQATMADQNGNIPGLIAASNALNVLANQEVMYLYTINPYGFTPVTSNVHGSYFNPSMWPATWGGWTPYFASMY